MANLDVAGMATAATLGVYVSFSYEPFHVKPRSKYKRSLRSHVRAISVKIRLQELLEYS